jgi:hypothetical protein
VYSNPGKGTDGRKEERITTLEGGMTVKLEPSRNLTACVHSKGLSNKIVSCLETPYKIDE